jgi:hypothetical protein
MPAEALRFERVGERRGTPAGFDVAGRRASARCSRL